MAIYFSDMSKQESSLLTDAMVQSGDQIDLSSIEGIKVDKHSTGGVGDTTTLTLAPLVASLGVKVAKMSGRGLGHTGGTLDKLESIEGFSIEIDNDEFIRLVNENNLAVIGQSEQLAPADKMIYSLRDVTATVNSIPLIASSIMSKKIASGADKIVLDVKCGKGAFMKEEAKAIELAQTMVAIGQQNGVGTSAIISSMEEPLGRAVGNALEMKEAIETLQGVGPDDLTELTLTLGAHMVLQDEKAASFDEAYYLLQQKLISGEALAIFKQFIAAQGGNAAVVDDLSLLPSASYQISVKANEAGYISRIDAEQVGKAAMLLGAGRQEKDDQIDMAVGVMVEKKIGEAVEKGEHLFTIHANQEHVKEVEEILLKSVSFSHEKKEQALILHTI